MTEPVRVAYLTGEYPRATDTWIQREVAGLRRRGVDVPASRVVVAPGAKPIVAYALQAVADPGDEIIVPDPGCPIYASVARFLDLEPVPLPLRPSNDFRPDLDELRALISRRTRMLVINSPHNPTGGMLTRSDLEGIAAIAMAHDLLVLTDEIYGRLVHEGEHHSLLAVDGMACLLYTSDAADERVRV